MTTFPGIASALTSDDKTLVVTFWAAFIASGIALLTLAAQLIGPVKDEDSRSMFWALLMKSIPFILVPVSAGALWLGLLGTGVVLSMLALVLV
jgi:hypothetical protein